jgi:HAD superfamily hydrolase (TIGR01509 family)
MTEMRDVLVFDYDGVLADTEPLHWKSWAALLSRYDVQLGWEDYCTFGRGIDDAQMYKTLQNRALLPGTDDFVNQNRERKRIVQEWSLAEIPISTETIAMLKGLDGFRIGLVTSSERSEVEPVLRAAQIYDVFDAMVFGDEVAAPKPSPAPYQLVAQKLGIDTGIAFEDSEPGLASARTAGFRAIKVEHPKDLPQIVAQSLAVV